MRELRGPGAFAERPDIGCACLKPLIDTNIAALVQLDTCVFKIDPCGVGDASGRDQDVAAVDGTFAICQATSLPPSPLPRTRISYCSAWAMDSSACNFP
jgi:hypothetical protein